MNTKVYFQRERVNFIRKALIIIDLLDKLLVADREFMGKEWLSSLIEMKVNFIIRLRKKMYQSYIELSGYSYQKSEKKALKKGIHRQFLRWRNNGTKSKYGNLIFKVNLLST